MLMLPDQSICVCLCVCGEWKSFGSDKVFTLQCFFGSILFEIRFAHSNLLILHLAVRYIQIQLCSQVCTHAYPYLNSAKAEQRGVNECGCVRPDLAGELLLLAKCQ